MKEEKQQQEEFKFDFSTSNNDPLFVFGAAPQQTNNRSAHNHHHHSPFVFSVPNELKKEDEEEVEEIFGNNRDNLRRQLRDDEDDEDEDEDFDDEQDFEDDPDFEKFDGPDDDLLQQMLLNQLLGGFMSNKPSDQDSGQPKQQSNRASGDIKLLDPQKMMNFWMLVSMDSCGLFMIARDALAKVCHHFTRMSPPQKYALRQIQSFEEHHFQPEHEFLLEMIDQIKNLSDRDICPEIDKQYAEKSLSFIERQEERKSSCDNPSKWKDEYDFTWNEFGDDEDEDEEEDDKELSEREKSNQEERSTWKSIGCDLYRFEVGTFSPIKNYRGQFRLKVDSNNKNLLIYLTQYVCDPNKYVDQFDDAMQIMHSHFNDFIVSRRMRIKISIDDISGIHFHKYLAEDEPGKALVVLRVTQTPVFETQRIFSSSSLRNKWRRRSDFTTNKSASKYTDYYLIADDKDLSQIVSLLCESSPKFKDLYSSKSSLGNRNQIVSQLKSRKPVWEYDRQKDEGVIGSMKKQKVLQLKPEITDLLQTRGILTQDMLLLSSPLQSFSECFRDFCYLNSAKQLQEQLDKVQSCEGCNRDYTIADLLKSGGSGCAYKNCSGFDYDSTSYSFCYGEMITDDHDSHCSDCHRCVDWHNWHCFNCNRCTYGQSIPTCSHCGSNGNYEGKATLKPGTWSGGYESDDEEIEAEDEDSETDEPDFPKEPKVGEIEQQPQVSQVEMMSFLLQQMLSGGLTEKVDSDEEYEDDY